MMRMRPGLTRVVATLAIVLGSVVIDGCSILDFLHRKSDDLTVLWHVPGQGASTPAYDGQIVYFLSADHSVLALRGETGSKSGWDVPTTNRAWRSALADAPSPLSWWFATTATSLRSVVSTVHASGDSIPLSDDFRATRALSLLDR